MITASSTAHADLIVAAAGAGKAVFCEKPMAMTLADADRAIAAAEDGRRPAAGRLQPPVRRATSRAAHELIVDGAIGTPQLMRSLTRDPGLANPGGVPPWTIFTQTLIHDFDTLLWLNPGAEPVEVYAMADALVAPDFKDAGLLDTAVVVIRFDNGAIAMAEASFSAAYGYDVRGEVFGSAGMVTAGDRRTARRWRLHDGPAVGRRRRAATSSSSATPTPASSSSSPPPSARAAPPAVTGERRPPRARGRAGLHRVRRRRTHRSPVDADRGGGAMSRSRWPSAPRWSSSTCRSSSGYAASTTLGLPGRDLGLDRARTSTRWRRPARTSRR